MVESSPLPQLYALTSQDIDFILAYRDPQGPLKMALADAQFGRDLMQRWMQPLNDWAAKLLTRTEADSRNDLVYSVERCWTASEMFFTFCDAELDKVVNDPRYLGSIFPAASNNGWLFFLITTSFLKKI